MIAVLYAQEINLHFPHFAGHQYEWKIFQGKDQITVQAALSASVKNTIASVKILTGTKGPDLIFQAPVLTQTGLINQDISIETANLNADYTILLFYQGECPLCEDALIDLANKHARLKEQNAWVIAISADNTEQGFQKKIAYQQWPDNYCDFTGMAGENFNSYGVLGVPSLFLLDQEGMVLKKTAMVNELIKAIDVKM